MKSQAHIELKKFDDELRLKYGRYIAGIDECGRGSLAGPLVAACVVLDERQVLEGVNDSKKLTEKKREELYDRIITSCVSYGLVEISAEDIDKFGIQEANLNAMINSASLASKHIDELPHLYVIDQGPKNNLKPQLMIPKADSSSLAVAAASIIAKVHHDRVLAKLHEEYPEYDLISNKGYITAKHKEAVVKYGLQHFHRKSYTLKLG
jgi:ribonuclease HII